MANRQSSSGLSKFGDLKNRLLFLLGALVVFRIGAHIPVPGVDAAALAKLYESASGGMLGMLNMFSGGSLERFSIFAIGIMPYISASIIVQLASEIMPSLKALKKEGEAGRRVITKYTRYGTVLLALLQSFGVATFVYQQNIVVASQLEFYVSTVVCLVTGTMFLMWLGEQMTERGIGNGISLIIFCGIVVGIPRGIIQSVALIQAGDMSIFMAVVIVALMAAVTVAIVFVERSQRRIPISYAKRQVGRKMYGGQNSHLPLRLNTAGVIPPIFASSLLLFPATIGQFSTNQYVKQAADFFSPHGVAYNVLYVALMFFFCYFYTAIIFDPKDMAENLKKNGGFIPGIRPGEKTQEYVDTVLSRLTLSGATYISLVCLLPMLLISNFNVPFYFGGTSLLILVGVAMDFMNQVESHMISSQYQGLMAKARKSGRL